MASNALIPGSPADPPATEADLALMARNGIVRTEAFNYHVGGYRYTNLRDALAQAARKSGVREDGA